MTKPLWILCFGLFCCIALSQAHIAISCRFKGVFHVEKIDRYRLDRDEARKTCSDLDAIIATKEQVDIAHQFGFETCRYGWVENSTVLIPRITSNHLCAAGYIGVFILTNNLTTMYDVYCYNSSETSEKNCEQYDYQNKSVPSYDPTEEGDIIDSSPSDVSPTHTGHDINSSVSEQGGPVEDNIFDPLMSTELPEHSGDHAETQEDTADTKRPNLGPGVNEIDNSTELEGFIQVQPTDDAFDPSKDNEPETEPPIQRETGSINDGEREEEPNGEIIEMRPDPTDDMESPSGPAEESSGDKKTIHLRRAAIPEWLIVCVSLVCLGLIFSVCIAINAGRICGQKKKLVINGSKGSPEHGVIMEQNGDTVKSQEMVQLVSRDQTSDLGEGDALTQVDVRNAKNVDMKI